MKPPLSQAEITQRWSAIGNEWLQWWTAAAARAGQRFQPIVETPRAAVMPRSAAADDAATQRAPTTTPSGLSAGTPALPFDSQALEALNAKYRPRLEALWSAFTTMRTPEVSDAGSTPEIAVHARVDRRFRAREWNELPYFALLKESYLLIGDYLTELAQLALLPPRDKQVLEYMTKQYVDALAPSNFVATNPDVLKKALETHGASLVQGLDNLVADSRHGRISMSDQRAFRVGGNLAITPGSVVFRNDLIEVIQYAPSTARVYRRPLVIVPPCINKYYILDLQPENSFVKWAVGEGHSVFLISWRNIPAALGRLTWDDYIEAGALTAIDVAREVSGSKTVNALGFCVGGTLLASSLAVLAARGERKVESATLLTTMLDFAEPGDIGFYVSHERLAARTPSLMEGERISGAELAAAFASLRPNELVWHYVVNNYLKGETPPAFDLLYWNGDSSNLAGPMYVYYVTSMYLDNKLCEPGALTMAGQPIDLGSIAAPMYLVASREDHIVPWRSAYKSVTLLGGDVTFVLAASGHIAGVINPPAKGKRNYWTNALLTDDPDEWLARADLQPGSWWPDWGAWLAPHAGSMQAAPRRLGSEKYPALDPAPGRYVLEAPR